MQVDPIKPKLKPPRTKRLKLDYDELLSNFAFKFNLRRYIKGFKSFDVSTLTWAFAHLGHRAPGLVTGLDQW